MKDKPGSISPRDREAILSQHRSHRVLVMLKVIANTNPNLQSSTVVSNTLPNSPNTHRSTKIKHICHSIHHRAAVLHHAKVWTMSRLATAAIVLHLIAKVDESYSMLNHSETHPTLVHASAGPVSQKVWLHLPLHHLPLLHPQKERMELIVRLTMKDRAGRQSKRSKHRSKRWCYDKSHPWAEGLAMSTDYPWHLTAVTLYSSPQTLMKSCSRQRALLVNGMQMVI